MAVHRVGARCSALGSIHIVLDVRVRPPCRRSDAGQELELGMLVSAKPHPPQGAKPSRNDLTTVVIASNSTHSSPQRRLSDLRSARANKSPLIVHAKAIRGIQCLPSLRSAPLCAPRPPSQHDSPPSSSRCPSAGPSRNPSPHRVAMVRVSTRHLAGYSA